MRSPFVFALAAAAAFASSAVASGSATQEFKFEKFRPKYHFVSPTKWINEPSAIYYDPKTELYNLYVQHNPNASFWDVSISWSHAVSKDLITWTDMPLAILPDPKGQDSHGCFTGDAIAVGYKGLPTAYYTAASGYILFTGEEYVRGSEKLAMATSSDNGRTWEKHPVHLLGGPPEHSDAIGWRDPKLFTSAELDRKFGVPEGSLPTQYMSISGGERGKGGRLFLYTSDDWVTWHFKGYLFKQAPDAPTTAHDGSGMEWIADSGLNFEVANTFSLSDDSGDLHHFIVLGVEGGRQTSDRTQWSLDHGRVYWNLWFSGDFVRSDDGSVSFKESNRGITDSGIGYGSYGFWDTKTGRRIMFSWLTEDMVPTRKEWAGVLSMPHEMFVATYYGVVDPENRLATLGPFMVSDGPKIRDLDTKVVRTLGIRPIREVETLRGPDVFTFRAGEHEYPSEIPIRGSLHYEIVATAKNVPEGGRVGFVIRHTADGSEQTVVYLDRERGRIVIDRSRSTKTEGIFAEEESGKFELFQVAGSCKHCPVGTETLSLRIFVDNSVVEVYANDRFTISSRIYPSDDADRLSTYGTNGAHFDSIDVHYNFKSVFPDRPGGGAGAGRTSLPLNQLAESSDASHLRAASVIALSAATAGTLVSTL